MKEIKQVPAIALTNSGPSKVSKIFTMGEWLEVAINSNPLFGKGFKNIALGMKLLSTVQDQEGKENYTFEDADFAKLKDSVEACEWNPAVAFQLFPFHEAIEAATDPKAPEAPAE